MAEDPPIYLVSELPGVYILSNGFDTQKLELLADKRFSFRWTGCGREVSRSLGGWRLEKGVLVLTPETNGEFGPFVDEVRLVPVPWGARFYLVEERGLAGFAASVRDQFVAAHGEENEILFDFVKVDALFRLPRMTGQPRLPRRAQQYLRKGPQMVRVTSIASDGTVTLRSENGRRLEVGAWLVRSELDGYLDLEVLSVSGASAKARPWYSFGSEHGPKIGEQLTTGDRRLRSEAQGRRLYRTLGEAERARERFMELMRGS
jgi:hypothetical protein